MPRSIESMLAASNLATERRRQGRPIWDERLRALRDDCAPFEKNRDWFVTALEESRWYRGQDLEAWGELQQLWDEIKDSETADHFDSCLDAIYDLADEARVWIQFVRVAELDAENGVN